jgi:hypothetical protein
MEFTEINSEFPGYRLLFRKKGLLLPMENHFYMTGFLFGCLAFDSRQDKKYGCLIGQPYLLISD